MGKYDDELKQIPFYKIHPELLPFVGSCFDDYSILLVGESHYIDQTSENIRYDNSYFLNHWWNGTHSEIESESFSGWYNTRGVIENYLMGNRSKGHLIFSNLVKAFSECVLNQKVEQINTENSQVFRYFAFLNFFQMPSLIKGEKYWNSLCISDQSTATELWNVCKDNSAKVLDAVIDTLEPKVVIFSSNSAFEAYQESNHNTEHNSLIKSVPHAGCSWWNKKSKKHDNKSGKELFIDILKKSLR